MQNKLHYFLMGENEKITVKTLLLIQLKGDRRWNTYFNICLMCLFQFFPFSFPHWTLLCLPASLFMFSSILNCKFQWQSWQIPVTNWQKPTPILYNPLHCFIYINIYIYILLHSSVRKKKTVSNASFVIIEQIQIYE